MKKNGATIWARQTIESKIFFYKPDKWFKIWFYVVLKVNWENSKLFKRGECLITYKNIMEGTGATKKQIENCVKWLKKEKMLETKRTTRGRIYFVLNYAKYQDLSFYKGEAKGEDRGVLKENRRRIEGGADNKRRINRINRERARAPKGDKKIKILDNLYFTEEERVKLNNEFETEELHQIMKELDAHITSTGTEYGSHYGTVKLWIVRNQKKR